MLFHLLTAATEAPVVENLTDAGMVGAAGYAVVFVGIALLIAVMVITSKIMQRKKPEEEAAPARPGRGTSTLRRPADLSLTRTKPP